MPVKTAVLTGTDSGKLKNPKSEMSDFIQVLVEEPRRVGKLSVVSLTQLSEPGITYMAHSSVSDINDRALYE